MTDNPSEFRSGEFTPAVERLGAGHAFIRAGRTPDQRVWGEGPRDDPRGVLEAGLRPVPYPQADRSPTGPGTIRHLLQHRPDLHRTVDQGPDPRTGHREGEDVVPLGGMCRHILGRTL
jgi:hypothetical protein